MLKKNITLTDSASTKALGFQLGKLCKDTMVFALSGQLGTGKTTLAQGVADGLGVTELVNSPTFTMFNEYTSGRLPFYHLDLYRLQEDLAPLKTIDNSNSQSDISGNAMVSQLKLELEECLMLPGIVLIEWIELNKDLISSVDDCVRITLAYAAEPGNDIRSAVLQATGQKSTELLQETMKYAGL